MLIFGCSCCLVEIMKMKYDQDFFVKLPKEVTLVTRTQHSGPLCLWQCFLMLLFLFRNRLFLSDMGTATITTFLV